MVAKRRGAKGGMVPGFPCFESGNWGQECDSLLYLVIALREQRNIYRIRCFEISFGKNHALDVHLTYKDVDRTRDGTVHKLSCLKACQMSTVHARSYERTHEPCRSSKLRKHRQKIDDYWLKKQTMMLKLTRTSQMLKKSGIGINRTS